MKQDVSSRNREKKCYLSKRIRKSLLAMTGFEDIQDIQEQLASYILGDLTPEEVAEVHQLLATHPELEAEISQLQKTLALFPLALPEVQLPSALGSQILQRASDSLTAPMTMGDGNIRKKKLIPWPSLIAGLAAAMVAGLGFYSYRLNQAESLNEIPDL